MTEFHRTNPLVTGIDPAVLDAQRQANAALAGFPHPDPHTPEGLQMLRALTANNTAGTKLAPADRTITTPHGNIRLHAFVPDGPVRGVMLDIHGGGWAAGAPEDDDTVNDHLARACRLAVIAPEYRLVPEATIAEQIDQCVAVAEWLAASAAAEFGSGTLLIGGISAGAHLAAATVLALRAADSPAFAQIAAARLDSGPYDLGLTASAYLPTSHSPVLPHSWLVAFLEMGLPGYTLDQRRAPGLSPMMNDLSGLPPALFTVGALDPLRDESILMAQRWQLAGSRADLDVWPEGDHAFSNMATPLGDLAVQRTTRWITAALDQPAPPAPARADGDPVTVVYRFLDEVVNGGNLQAIDELWAEDLAWHGGSLGDFHGLAALKAHMAANTAGAFTGMHLSVKDIVPAENKVAVLFTNSGTQTGPFLGAPPTGRHAQWLGIGIYTVTGGKISEGWFGEDILGLLTQLGILNLPNAAAR